MTAEVEAPARRSHADVRLDHLRALLGEFDVSGEAATCERPSEDLVFERLSSTRDWLPTYRPKTETYRILARFAVPSAMAGMPEFRVLDRQWDLAFEEYLRLGGEAPDRTGRDDERQVILDEVDSIYSLTGAFVDAFLERLVEHGSAFCPDRLKELHRLVGPYETTVLMPFSSVSMMVDHSRGARPWPVEIDREMPSYACLSAVSLPADDLVEARAAVLQGDVWTNNVREFVTVPSFLANRVDVRVLSEQWEAILRAMRQAARDGAGETEIGALQRSLDSTHALTQAIVDELVRWSHIQRL